MALDAADVADAAADAALLARLAPPAPTGWHRLNPLTKVALAAAGTVTPLALGGYLAPALAFLLLVAPGAIVARAARAVVVRAALLTLPLAIAVGLVSVLTRPGATVLFQLGPFDATLEGADFAARVSVRLFVMAAALTLFGLTTPPRALVVDLERRGVSPRLAFALGSIVGALPVLVERARAVADAQRARGLDLDASARRRVAAVVPLAGPVVIGSLHEVEARSLALEARAFGRPGPRHLLWTPPDDARQRIVRWVVLAGLVVLAAGAVAGVLPRLP